MSFDEWYEGHQEYYTWFGQKYLRDKVAADFYTYDGHTPIAIFVLDNLDYDLETRQEFWQTLDDILAWGVTTNCPAEEIC